MRQWPRAHQVRGTVSGSSARNQIGLTFAATIGVLMVLATCVSVWLAVHADRAKRDAELQQSKASDANDALTEKIAELQQARDKMSRMLVDLKSSQQKASDNFGYAVSSLRDFLVEFAVLDLQGKRTGKRTSTHVDAGG